MSMIKMTDACECGAYITVELNEDTSYTLAEQHTRATNVIEHFRARHQRDRAPNGHAATTPEAEAYEMVPEL